MEYYSHMNEQTITTYNITGESHKPNYVEQEKPDTRAFTVWLYFI